jgi:predicted RNA-binding protein associated with RNAse of E/G family
MQINHADVLFGQIALRKGFVTREQIEEAVKIQKERATEGLEHRLIGSLLYSLGYMRVEQINEVIEEQQEKA